MADVYVRKDYEWDTHQVRPYILDTMLTLLQGHEVSRESTVLDAGCGSGYVTNWFYQRGFQNVWAFDVATEGISMARSSFPDLSGVFFEHDAYESRLPDGIPHERFDLVLSVEVLEHLFSPVRYFSSLSSWVKEGGYLLVTTPYHGYLKNLATALLNRCDSHYGSLWEGGHIKFFSKETLTKLVEDSGFQVLDYAGCGRFPPLWKTMAMLARRV